MSRAAIAAALLAIAVTACAGADGQHIAAGVAKSLVLQPADLPRGFIRFGEGPERRREHGGDVRSRMRGADVTARAGWHARYRRPGTAETRGPLVVESRVEVFEDTEDADGRLDSYRSEFGAADLSGARRAVGDETIVARTIGVGARFFVVAWRYRNVAALVNVSGVRGVNLDDALALARRQQRRVEAAA